MASTTLYKWVESPDHKESASIVVLVTHRAIQNYFSSPLQDSTLSKEIIKLSQGVFDAFMEHLHEIGGAIYSSHSSTLIHIAGSESGSYSAVKRAVEFGISVFPTVRYKQIRPVVAIVEGPAKLWFLVPTESNDTRPRRNQVVGPACELANRLTEPSFPEARRTNRILVAGFTNNSPMYRHISRIGMLLEDDYDWEHSKVSVDSNGFMGIREIYLMEPKIYKGGT